MIAARIGSVRIVLCASPGYLADRGRPGDPKDLVAHDCITIDDFGVPGSWKFLRQEAAVAEPIRVRSSGQGSAPRSPEPASRR